MLEQQGPAEMEIETLHANGDGEQPSPPPPYRRHSPPPHFTGRPQAWRPTPVGREGLRPHRPPREPAGPASGQEPVFLRTYCHRWLGSCSVVSPPLSFPLPPLPHALSPYSLFTHAQLDLPVPLNLTSLPRTPSLFLGEQSLVDTFTLLPSGTGMCVGCGRAWGEVVLLECCNLSPRSGGNIRPSLCPLSGPSASASCWSLWGQASPPTPAALR